MQEGQESMRIVVVVPLKPGARDAISALLDEGPPFEPGRAGLDRHEVFLSEQEAIFLFEAADQAALDRLARSTRIRAAAAAWQEHVAGDLRLADPAYVWRRSSAPP